MSVRSIFTALILSVITTQAWAQTVPSGPGPRPAPPGARPRTGRTAESFRQPALPRRLAIPGLHDAHDARHGAGRQPVPRAAARRHAPAACA